MSLHHVLMEVIKCSRNIQASRPLLEFARGRRVVLLQIEVTQVALFRELVDNVVESSTFCLFAQNRGIFCSLTSCSSMTVGSCHTGGPVLFRTGGSLGGTWVEDLRHQ